MKRTILIRMLIETDADDTELNREIRLVAERVGSGRCWLATDIANNDQAGKAWSLVSATDGRQGPSDINSTFLK